MTSNFDDLFGLYIDLRLGQAMQRKIAALADPGQFDDGDEDYQDVPQVGTVLPVQQQPPPALAQPAQAETPQQQQPQQHPQQPGHQNGYLPPPKRGPGRPKNPPQLPGPQPGQQPGQQPPGQPPAR